VERDLGLAAVNPAAARPRLKPGVVYRRLATREEDYVIVKDGATQKFFKFEPWEDDLLALIDGSRTPEEIAREFSAKNPQRPLTEAFVQDYLEALKGLDLLERGERERHLVMMDKLKTMRKRRFYDAERSTIFQVHIPLFDPNAIMDRVIPWIRWVWSPWFVLPWMAIFAVMLGFLVYHWDLYWSGFFELWNFKEKTAWGWVGFFALLAGVSIWHEFGHGFTCKRFGGEVHDIGFMIFYFQPAFYCNIDDSYLFEKQSHRLYSTFGGPYFELMLASVATVVWLATPAESWVHDLALTLVFFTGLSVIVLNVNPLLKLDGYYLLMDWLDVPNLREESFEYIGGLFKKHVLRLEVPEHAISRRRRRIYLVYGVAAVLYMVLMIAVIYHFLERWFVGWLGPAGYIALGLFFYWLLRSKLKAFGRFVRHLWLDKREWLATAQGKASVAIAVVLLAAALLLVPLPTRITGPFVVEPAERAVVRVPSDALVTSVAVREGDRVAVGAELARLASPELEADRAAAESARVRALREASRARDARDAASEAAARELARAAESRLAMLEARQGRLVLAAPIAGIVSTYRVEEMAGRQLAEGETVCVIDGLARARLAARLSERDIEEVRVGAPARIRAESLPGRTLRATVRDVAPVAVDPEGGGAHLDLVRRARQVRVLVEVDNPGEQLRPGMSGAVQFSGPSRSALGQLWWSFSRWISTVVW
jgi:putative peptide zinc metalloprotease protein